jgi:hypothetical protein
VWLGVEQPGPWGARVITVPGASHLPEQVRAQLELCNGLPGATAVLLRRPGPHHRAEAPREVLLASVVPGRRWLRRVHCPDLAGLGELDLVAAVTAALHGEPPAWGEAVAGPVVLVCTNGQRDRCCALRGRPAALELVQLAPGSVWETSHLGGHRFSPTVLALPLGAVYGGHADTTLPDLLRRLRNDELPVTNLRGLTAQSSEQQVADIHVRVRDAVVDPDGVWVGAVESDGLDSCLVEVTGASGREVVRIHRTADADRPESCDGPPVESHVLHVATDG